MPLIIICGNPCTGKTTFTNSLASFLINHGIEKVEVVNEELLGINKAEGYKTSSIEKSTRGSLKSNTDHRLSGQSFVIVDSLNYIKGFRYELFCSARTFRTPHCVVWVECPTQTADAWNEIRRGNNPLSAYDVGM
jgi:protein KTI12